MAPETQLMTSNLVKLPHRYISGSFQERIGKNKKAADVGISP